MLDSETKRRIDTARDILVGKVPDPKSQVEQITIALIYKFMDDMDAEAEELGGKRSFFVGEYEKYSWAKLMSSMLGGYEMLSLYSEAIDKMTRNEGIPQLFRDIFKNAYLPYRDPETLKLFLKTINEFVYDHSERLGDAFEYLLSVLGSQGEAGQFRTPRHIIDFMVKVVDPKKTDSVLDPACGTAGFLISAYKHILAMNAKDGKPGASLTPEERTRLANNLRGYDISPDMVRLSLVNLYLHGFTTPHIYEYDTLTSEERWNDYADVILANPPFMSPKGGIRPHKRFSVQSNRSEVLFVDYMAEHLTPAGRAGIIVPEGVIFQSGGAYKQLRKYLIEQNYLWAVVSLPSGVFNPYAGVKTSILFLDRSLAKKIDQILFVKVEYDGFDLGAQRRPIERSDLKDALNTLRSWYKAVLGGKPEIYTPFLSGSFRVSLSKLAENGDYNLSAERYREVTRIRKLTYPLVELGDICEIISGQSPEGKYYNDKGEGMPFYQGKTEFTEKYLGAPTTWTINVTKIAEKDDILMSVRAPVGPVNIATQKICIGRGLAGIRPDTSKALLEYVFVNLKIKQDEIKGNSGSTFASIKRDDIAKIQIPLPPLNIQQQIVNEITSYQYVIDGARQVVEGWKPNLDLELDESLPGKKDEWEFVKLGEICSFMTGGTPRTSIKEYYKNGTIPWLVSGDIHNNEIFDCEGRITQKGLENSNARFLPKDSVMIALNGQGKTRGTVALLRIKNATCSQSLVSIDPMDKNKLLSEFLYYQLKSMYQQIRNITGDNQRSGLNIPILKSIKIPLPPLNIQREIVAHIEGERSIVEGNRKLIQSLEEKVKKVIERVWEG